jgi:hypothetical protein
MFVFCCKGNIYLLLNLGFPKFEYEQITIGKVTGLCKFRFLGDYLWGIIINGNIVKINEYDKRA